MTGAPSWSWARTNLLLSPDPVPATSQTTGCNPLGEHLSTVSGHRPMGRGDACQHADEAAGVCECRVVGVVGAVWLEQWSGWSRDLGTRSLGGGSGSGQPQVS